MEEFSTDLGSTGRRYGEVDGRCQLYVPQEMSLEVRRELFYWKWRFELCFVEECPF